MEAQHSLGQNSLGMWLRISQSIFFNLPYVTKPRNFFNPADALQIRRGSFPAKRNQKLDTELVRFNSSDFKSIVVDETPWPTPDQNFQVESGKKLNPYERYERCPRPRIELILNLFLVVLLCFVRGGLKSVRRGWRSIDRNSSRGNDNFINWPLDWATRGGH